MALPRLTPRRVALGFAVGAAAGWTASLLRSPSPVVGSGGSALVALPDDERAGVDAPLVAPESETEIGDALRMERDEPAVATSPRAARRRPAKVDVATDGAAQALRAGRQRASSALDPAAAAAVDEER